METNTPTPTNAIEIEFRVYTAMGKKLVKKSFTRSQLRDGAPIFYARDLTKEGFHVRNENTTTYVSAYQVESVSWDDPE